MTRKSVIHIKTASASALASRCGNRLDVRKLQLLWIDLTASIKEAKSLAAFQEYCDIERCSDVDHLHDMLSRHPVEGVCFDFDYPDPTGFRLFRDNKLDRPSLPMIMLTIQHYEALAIWPLRTRVWDYLVKPIPRYELKRCLSALLRGRSQRQSQNDRTVAMHSPQIPQEVSHTVKPDDFMLAPAIYYVERYFRPKIRSEQVGRFCGMSPFRFSRAFKREPRRRRGSWLEAGGHLV